MSKLQEGGAKSMKERGTRWWTTYGAKERGAGISASEASTKGGNSASIAEVLSLLPSPLLLRRLEASPLCRVPLPLPTIMEHQSQDDPCLSIVPASPQRCMFCCRSQFQTLSKSVGGATHLLTATPKQLPVYLESFTHDD